MSLRLGSIGPYRLLAQLGEGGMGVVFRAEHRETGQLVALKTVRVLQAGLIESIRREIHALARLRHPGVVRILAEGLQDGVPWYAMELLEAEALRLHPSHLGALSDATGIEPWWAGGEEATRWARASPAGDAPATAPESLPCLGSAGQGILSTGALGQEFPAPARGGRAREGGGGRTAIPLLTLMRRLCETLAYVHGEGIVHRDLKPGNILVRADGMPVLVDFGLVARSHHELSREALQLSGATGGTTAYMAPEQARGELLDARADLYSLGCILYEILTGRPPFLANTPQLVLWMHQTQQPLPPSRLASSVSPRLDGLVLHLLAKNPRDRLGHADDVSAALAALGALDSPDSLPAPRPYLYRPGFAGRTSLMALLGTHLARLQDGLAGVILVGGESGSGKTRLLLEIAQKAAATLHPVLAGDCAAHGQPLHALQAPLQAVADRCLAGGPAVTEALVGRRGSVLALYEPAFLGLPGQVEAQDVAPLPADAARLRLYVYLAETFAAFAAGQPLLLLLDDLHAADELTLGFLEHLSRSRPLASGPAPVLVVGAYRSEDVGATLAAPQLKRLIQAPGITCLELDRLGPDEITAMVRDMLALDPPPRDFVQFIALSAEGNPFFVAEMLRAAVEAGLLSRDQAGRWLAPRQYELLALPRSLLDLVARRLEGLGAQATGVLEAAAALGREFDESLLAALLLLPEPALLDATSELLRRQILEQPAPGRLRFTHQRLRGLAYERTDPSRRLSLHRAAAEHLSASQSDRTLADLAPHWEAAGEILLARHSYLAAARSALKRHAQAEAERLFRAGLALFQGPDPQSLRARNDLGWDLLQVQGRLAEARDEYRLALAEARALGDRQGEALSLHNLAYVHRRTAQTAESRALFEQALALACSLGDRSLELHTLNNLALLDSDQGRLLSARALFEHARALSREVGDCRLEGKILGNLATLAASEGHMCEAFALNEQVLAIAREVRDRRFEGHTLGNLAMLHLAAGRFDLAEVFLDQSLLIGREVGDRRFECITLGNRAFVHMQRGQLSEAEAACLQALAIVRQVGDRRFEGHTLGNLGLLYQRMGRLDEAHELLSQAFAITAEFGDPRHEGFWLQHRARLERQRGLFTEASRTLDQAERRLRQGGDQPSLGVVLCERVHLFLAQGRDERWLLQEAEQIAFSLDDDARSDLDQALARLYRALAAFDAGLFHLLVRGECLDDLPGALRVSVQT